MASITQFSCTHDTILETYDKNKFAYKGNQLQYDGKKADAHAHKCFNKLRGILKELPKPKKPKECKKVEYKFGRLFTLKQTKIAKAMIDKFSKNKPQMCGAKIDMRITEIGNSSQILESLSVRLTLDSEVPANINASGYMYRDPERFPELITGVIEYFNESVL
ncbi:hypothetical protein BVY03_00685 [bacterium K02(2017)]|nr:hypothetical protein BVY03_00685 [bacterium K02(2017)]